MGNKNDGNSERRSQRSSRRVPEERFERLNDLSPSAKFVYRVLHEGDSLTQDEIIERTLLPIRTVRYAISKLEQEDLIEKRTSTKDARTKYYFAKSVEWRDDNT